MKVRKLVVRLSLKNWTELNKRIGRLNKEEVIYALELENEREVPRQTFLTRLTQRYNAIAAEEVRRELE